MPTKNAILEINIQIKAFISFKTVAICRLESGIHYFYTINMAYFAYLLAGRYWFLCTVNELIQTKS